LFLGAFNMIEFYFPESATAEVSEDNIKIELYTDDVDGNHYTCFYDAYTNELLAKYKNYKVS